MRRAWYIAAIALFVVGVGNIASADVFVNPPDGVKFYKATDTSQLQTFGTQCQQAGGSVSLIGEGTDAQGDYAVVTCVGIAQTGASSDTTGGDYGGGGDAPPIGAAPSQGTPSSNITPTQTTNTPQTGGAPAVNFIPLVPQGIPGLTDQNTVNQTLGPNGNFALFFNNLYFFLIGAAVILAVIMIIWGGIEIAINKDNVSKLTDSKGKIANALFGLLLVLAPTLVFTIINPAILNLAVPIPALETGSGTSAPSSSSGGQSPPSGSTGITSSGNVLYACSLDTASNPSYVYATDQCASAIAKCTGSGGTYENVRCMDTSGSITSILGRQDSFVNPYSSYACKAGQTIQVLCRPSLLQ